MNTTRADVAADEPGGSSRSSGATPDIFAVNKENPDDLEARQQAVSVAFEASGLSLAAFAKAHPDMVEKLLPATPWYQMSGYVATDEDLIKYKLKFYRAYLAQCSRVTPDERKNFEFLINYYENGGSPPPAGTTRWVRGGQFAPEGYSEAAVKNRENQTCDAGLRGGFHQITARIRAKPVLAGIPNPPEINIDIYNDTGSQIQSLHLADLQAIGLDPWNPQFGGFTGMVHLFLAQGQEIDTFGFEVEMKIAGLQGAQLTELTDWFTTHVVLDHSGGSRLSGSEMRQHLYFATAKGNVELYAGQTKTALQRRLPTI